MKRKNLILIGLIFFIGIITCSGKNDSNSFPLYKSGKVAAIYVSETDAPQIIRAAGDLQNDIEMVTGRSLKLFIR